MYTIFECNFKYEINLIITNLIIIQNHFFKTIL